jgi:hypothetical protein
MAEKILSGVVHTVPTDVRTVLLGSPKALAAWNSLTPLARNEWLCWVISVKQFQTRADHVQRLKEDLVKGKRRPCCWAGCTHRMDKPLSASQKYVLQNKRSKSSQKVF